LTAHTRGDITSDPKPVKIAVCQLPMIELADDAEIYGDFEANSGLTGNIQWISTVNDLLTVHECSLCVPLYRIVDGDGNEVTEGISIDEKRII
jgi:hypothetical protein